MKTYGLFMDVGDFRTLVEWEIHFLKWDIIWCLWTVLAGLVIYCWS